MTKVMMTLTLDKGNPGKLSLEKIRQRYSLEEHELDADFGLVEIDPEKGLFTILVEESSAHKIDPDGSWSAQGPYSNTRIAPFGPPQAAAGDAANDASQGNQEQDSSEVSSERAPPDGSSGPSND